jgi:hypothetical protein
MAVDVAEGGKWEYVIAPGFAWFLALKHFGIRWFIALHCALECSEINMNRIP